MKALKLLWIIVQVGGIVCAATWPSIAWGLGWLTGYQAIGFAIPSALTTVLVIVVVGSEELKRHENK